MDDITCEPRELQKIIKEQLGICGGDNAWRKMQKELQNVTRINLCGDQLEQLKKQFSEMAIKTAIPSLKDDWKMTTSMAKVKELSDTLRNAAYSKEMQEFQKQLKQYNISHATELYKRELAKSWQTAVKTSAMANNRLPAQNVAFVKFIPNDVNVDMPRGAKTVVRDLTKPAAKALTETEEVEFDPKEKSFITGTILQRDWEHGKFLTVNHRWNYFRKFHFRRLLNSRVNYLKMNILRMKTQWENVFLK